MKKAARPCTICVHEKRAQVDLALVHKVPARVIAARFGVGKDSVLRHGHNHLSPVSRAALLTARKIEPIDLEKLRVSESEGLLSQLVMQRSRLQQQAEFALEIGDASAAVAAERAITGNLTLVSKLLGQLVNIHDVRHSSILLTPDYVRLRQALTTALRPYPEAARAVAAALYLIESEAAKDISTGKTQVLIDQSDALKPLPPPPC